MQEYLGVTPPDDAKGVLQDIHWSFGGFGYFSTYALGNLVSAQLWEKINQDIPDLADQIRAGKFEALLGWLREKIHPHGRKFEPQELVQKVTGSRIDPAPYMRYLLKKYGEIYRLITKEPFLHDAQIQSKPLSNAPPACSALPSSGWDRSSPSLPRA